MTASPLQELQAFSAVARLGSFRRAAIDMGVSASALSHTIKGLEQRLGLRLLNRTTRSVSPTQAGQQLLARLVPALQDIASALEDINAFRESPMGTLRINAPRPACRWVAPPLVGSFLQSHPGMRVEVIADDGFVDIVAEGFDAGVRFGESLQQDMIAVPFGAPQRFVVVASPQHLARHGRPKHPRDLQHHPCIRIRFPSGSYFKWEFAKRQHAVQVEVDGPLACDDFSLMAEAAEAGVGLAYLYEQYALPGLEAGRLVRVLDDWCPPAQGFYLYHPSRKLMSAGLRAFVDHVRLWHEKGGAGQQGS